MSCKASPNVCSNSDKLAIDKEKFESVFKTLWQKMVVLTQPNLTEVEFDQVVETVNIPEGYRNLLLTVAADSARRNGHNKGMNLAIEACSNPVLVSLTKAWVERWQK